MLNKHLIATTYPKADEKNIVLWKDYRITVLSDRLFRLEKSKKLIFRDDATLTVWFRNVPPQKYSVQKLDSRLVIQTQRVKLVINENREDCFALIDGKEVKLNNDENLKGTYRTLDRCDGEYCDGKKIILENGVCSKNGIAVYDDSNVESLLQNGEIAKIYADGSDEYIFAFGQDYKGAVKALYEICGEMPLVPRYALGNWWSRYREYTDEEYLTLLHRFEEHNIPLCVATIDMDWHYSNHLDEQKKITESGRNTDFYGGNNGWTGYSWNKDLFVDYKDFLKKIKSKKLKITLNLHPADGVRWFEDSYTDMAKAVGIDSSSGEKIAFDIFDPTFANAYFSVLHKPYEKDGVDFWWIDWQQGKCAGKLGIDPLWALNHYHYLDNAKDKSDPLILSRYAGVGSHRYPLGFSGDTSITWATLNFLPYFTATSSNVGYGWWSHDIGGHHFGFHDGELYLRHVQYGVFSPINRYHCTAMPTVTKEPWAYLNGIGALAEEQMRLRHKLLPFLYTCDYRTHKNAEMLVEPLYYYHQNNQKAYQYKNEYYFGKSLLVAPVTFPSEKDGYSRVAAWLPQGRWVDIFTGDVYQINNENGEEKVLMRTLESIPVLAKAGTVLPLSDDVSNGAANPEKMTVKVWRGEGCFELFEDNRENGGSNQLITKFDLTQTLGEKVLQKLEISASGEYGIIPPNRTIAIRFEDIAKGKVSLFENAVPVTYNKIYADCVIVNIEFKQNVKYEIIVEYDKEDSLSEWKKRAAILLTTFSGSNMFITSFFNQLMQKNTVEEIRELFSMSGISETIIEKLSETL